MHSPEQMKKKAEARADALHHHENSAVDGPHRDMPTHERMYQGDQYSKEDLESINSHRGITAPAEHEYSGPGSNGKEYAEVEANLKKKGVDRKPAYNRKHNMYL